jgi:hypothetical protein
MSLAREGIPGLKVKVGEKADSLECALAHLSFLHRDFYPHAGLAFAA